MRSKKLIFKTYEPEEKFEIKKEEVVPHALNYGHKLGEVWGGFFLFFSGIILAIDTFFKTKAKIRDIQMKNEKVLDLTHTKKKKVWSFK